MYDQKMKFYLYMFLIGLNCASSSSVASAVTVGENREKIVAAFKQHQQKIQQASLQHDPQIIQQRNLLLDQLFTLHQQYPQDQKVIADYVLLSQAANRVDQDILPIIQMIQPSVYPVYAQMPLIQVLRDLKQFSLAAEYVKAFNQHAPDLQWQVLAILVQAEAADFTVAQRDLAQLLRTHQLQEFSADQLMQISYTYRRIQMPIEAMQFAQLALDKQQRQGPVSLDIHDQYVQSLMANGDFDLAKAYVAQTQIMQQHFPYLMAQIELGLFKQRIQNTIQRYKVLSYKNQGSDAFQALDQVLAEMAVFEQQLPKAHDPQAKDPQLKNHQAQALRQQFYYDYIYALNQRNQSELVFAQLLKLDHPVAQMPAYVRHAVADAALKSRQPQRAELLYASLQSEKNYMDYNAYAGWYYALIEQERYRDADHLLTQMDQALPKFSYSEAKGVDTSTHSDRIDYLLLKGLNYAYRNQHAKAEQYLRNLLATAPNHQGIQNALALVLRWRDKPQQSDWVLAQMNGLSPIAQSTQINQMQNRQALEDIPAWRQQDRDLMQRAAEDTGVKLSHKQLRDRDSASIGHQSTFSRSQSNSDALLQGPNGLRERQHHTRLNTPWFADHYRVWVDHQQRWSDFGDTQISDQRAGLGMEWASKRKYLSVLLSQGLDSDRTGLDLNWSHDLNDHWNYALGYQSQAALPLQALEAGEHGSAYMTALNWQANESRRAGMSYQWTDSSDNNLRQEASVYARQRIFQAPHHLTDAQISGYWGRNRDIDTAYFNPARSHSVELSLFHDWMTWRNYDRHFNQHFEFTLGSFSQKNYHAKPIYAALYRHDWRVSRTWELQYGVGWQLHPYDGRNEKNTYAMLGFEGRF